MPYLRETDTGRFSHRFTARNELALLCNHPIDAVYQGFHSLSNNQRPARQRFLRFHRVNDIAQRPELIRPARGHCWRHLQPLVHPREVVPDRIKRNHVAMVLERVNLIIARKRGVRDV